MTVSLFEKILSLLLICQVIPIDSLKPFQGCSPVFFVIGKFPKFKICHADILAFGILVYISVHKVLRIIIEEFHCTQCIIKLSIFSYFRITYSIIFHYLSKFKLGGSVFFFTKQIHSIEIVNITVSIGDCMLCIKDIQTVKAQNDN